MRIVYNVELLIIVVTIVACENLSEGPEAETGDAKGVIVQATLKDFQKSVFNTSFVLTGCYNGINNPNMPDVQSHGSPVNISNFVQPILLLVKSDDSGSSLSIRKLNEAGIARMPPAPRPALAQAIVNSNAIWINHGTPNN